ncbi:MAG: hypothetical protein Q9188_002397 [Gyalolechia gomerana]
MDIAIRAYVAFSKTLLDRKMVRYSEKTASLTNATAGPYKTRKATKLFNGRLLSAAQLIWCNVFYMLAGPGMVTSHDGINGDAPAKDVMV